MSEAAGGLIWRRTAGGSIEVLLVHRPGRDDWSVPKGKVRRRETARAAARREVLEETGLTCDVGPELATIRYLDRKGRDRVARYWAMTPVRGGFHPNAEVDAVRWVDLDLACDALTHAHEVPVVDRLVALLTPVG